MSPKGINKRILLNKKKKKKPLKPSGDQKSPHSFLYTRLVP